MSLDLDIPKYSPFDLKDFDINFKKMFQKHLLWKKKTIYAVFELCLFLG